jgi:predicted nucleotidyltransferase
MNRDEVLALLSSHLLDMQQRFGFQALALFGSVGRNEANVDSDVDVLVEFPVPPTFDQYMGLKLFLEDLLGRRVDLVTSDGLRDAVRPIILREAVRVA